MGTEIEFVATRRVPSHLDFDKVFVIVADGCTLAVTCARQLEFARRRLTVEGNDGDRLIILAAAAGAPRLQPVNFVMIRSVRPAFIRCDAK